MYLAYAFLTSYIRRFCALYRSDTLEPGASRGNAEWIVGPDAGTHDRDQLLQSFFDWYGSPMKKINRFTVQIKNNYSTMKRNLLIVTIVTSVFIGLLSCGGGDVKKSKEYLALKSELDKIKSQDSLEAANIAAYKKLNEDFMAGKKEDFLAGIADNFVDHNPDTAMTKKEGKAACEEGFAIITSAFSDMKMDYPHVMAEGDMVFAHCTMSGKNTGPMGPNMPATNGTYKDVDFYEVVRYENGKCAERWGLMDFNGMLAQMAATGTMTEQPK